MWETWYKWVLPNYSLRVGSSQYSELCLQRSSVRMPESCSSAQWNSQSFCHWVYCGPKTVEGAKVWRCCSSWIMLYITIMLWVMNRPTGLSGNYSWWRMLFCTSEMTAIRTTENNIWASNVPWSWQGVAERWASQGALLEFWGCFGKEAAGNL